MTDNYEITENIREFILGGNASFTILQNATPNTSEMQFKYKVSIPKGQTPQTTNVWYVSAELADFSSLPFKDGKNLKYQGYLNRELCFNIGRNGISNYNQKAINGLIWVLKHSNKLPDVVHIYHHGKCSVCGKALIDAKSLRSGVGPTCRKRLGI